MLVILVKISSIEVALNSFCRFFFNFAENCILLQYRYNVYLSQFANKKWRSLSLFFEFQALKDKIKGVFNRSYCCFGNLLAGPLCNTNMVASLGKQW